MRRCALTLWLMGLAWLVCASVACAIDISDDTGAMIGGISGIVALVGATAGCIGLCAKGKPCNS